MILESINRQLSTIPNISPSMKADMRIRNVYDLADVILCQKPFGMKFHKKECVDSHCKLCKNSKEKILNIFSKFIDAKGGHGVMKWQVWEQTTIVVNVRKKKTEKICERRKAKKNVNQ